MTAKQRIFLMADLWKAACRAQKWDVKDRAKRLEVCGQAVGRVIASTNDLNDTNDFGRVKARLQLLADNVRGAIEDSRPDLDEGRTHQHVIEQEIMPCLAVYLKDVPGYVNTIIRDKFYRAGWTDAPGLEDLSSHPMGFKPNGEEKPSQMKQLLLTLSARLNDLRNKAGDTGHEMRMKAGVRCFCATFCLHGRIDRRNKAAAAPAPEMVAAGGVEYDEEGNPKW